MAKERGRIISTEIWFQKYRILGQLGEGGTGSVFLAEHIRLKYFRAIKRIRKSHPAYEQLMQEADILKDLIHPGIPQIYDVEEDGEYSYIVMEYVKGLSLKDLCLKQGRIREAEIIKICLQICEVFQLLHSAEQPILYLDLKPGNIIVEESKIKIIDFGAAKKTGENRNSISMGTRGFAAPEQYTLEGVDRQSDIYGLGNLMLFMAVNAVGAAGLKLLEAEKEYSRAFKELVFQCLKYNKAERMETIDQIAERLLLLNPKEGEGLPDREGASVVAAFAGVQPRCGVTLICLMLTEYLCRQGQKAVYVEAGNKKDVQRLYLRESSWTCPILCGEPEHLKNKYQEYEVFVCDYGVYQEAGEAFWEKDTVCLVTGARPWEMELWESAEKEILRRKFHEKDGRKRQLYFLVNLISAREFFSLVKEKKISCLRMPYREKVLEEDKELSELAERLFKRSFYEEKGTKASKNSLFGWCRTWCRSNPYRYFTGRIFRRKKRGTNAVFRSK